MTPVFHPEAEAEFNAAIDWYEARNLGLGAEFAEEVRAAIGRALAFPHAWQALEGEVRRTLVHRYPYGVL
jgi:plasmid stabilization system protein ParE